CFLSERDRQILYRLRFGRTYGSPSTATRKATAFSIPRTAGLSGSSRVWLRRRKPSDSTVARRTGLAPIVLFINVAFRVFSAVEAFRAVTWSPWRRALLLLRRRCRHRPRPACKRLQGGGRRSGRPPCHATRPPAGRSSAA